MKANIRATLVLALVVDSPAAVQAGAGDRPAPVRPVVPDRVEARFVPAPLDAQTIEGVLGDRLGVNARKRLLEGVDPEPLLKGYRQRPGQQTWIGEHAAKFIDAATNAWVHGGDPQLKTKLDTTVRDLLATQLEDGYLGTYLEPDRFKDYGDIAWEPSEEKPLWDVWAHKYNLLALLNYYSRCGFQPALTASRRMGDLLCRTYGEGPGQRSIVRNDWHVGMANTSVLEAMAVLYRHTGEPRYLDFCRYIVRAWDEPKGPRIASTLLTKGNVREIGNSKAYEMTSNFVGLLELYRATGEEAFLRPVLIAWNDIVTNRLFVTGSASWAEMYRRDHLLRAEGRVGEGCVTTTWMQVNQRLLELTGEAKYADELERTIYNALLGAQHPESGLITYFMPLNGTKQYGAVSQGVPGVSCCTSSIPRGLTLIPSAAWGVRRGGVAVNLFIPGSVRLSLPAGEVTVVSTTRFPAEGDVTLDLRTPKSARFPLSIRVPAWCRKLEVTAAGKTWADAREGFVEIDRTWNDKDQVKIKIDLTPSLVPGGPAYPDHVAVRRGPQVLAADERLNPGAAPWMSDLWLTGIADAEPVLRDAKSSLPAKWRGTQAYGTQGYFGNAALGKTTIDLVLVPIADAGQLGGEYRVWLQRP